MNIFKKALCAGLVLTAAVLALPLAASAASMQKVTVNTSYAYVYIPGEQDRGETLSAPYYTSLPAGTVDYMTDVASENIPDMGMQTYCFTTSGRKLLKSQVTLGEEVSSIPANTITSVKVSADSKSTKIVIGGNWNVPFNVMPDGITYSGSTNTVSSFSPSKVIVTMDYSTLGTLSLPSSFPADSCFSGVTAKEATNGSVKQVVLTFSLKESAYYGSYARWNSKGQLELEFLNPVDSLKGARIFLDPGHGYNGSESEKDVGAVGNGLYEYQLNYAKALALKEELEKRGATVMMLDTMNENYHLLSSRVEAAVEWQPHLYVSLHHDSTTNSTSGGLTTYYNTPYSQPLAKNIQTALISAIRSATGYQIQDRGYKFKEYAVTCSKCFPSILIEHGFISNPTEISVMTDAHTLSVIASAEADAIEAFLLQKDMVITPVPEPEDPVEPEPPVEDNRTDYEKLVDLAADHITSFSESNP